MPSALTERFGAEFFRSIPSVPGVYLMCDDTTRVVYVGKAKNLRQRVGSYRHVHSSGSRKTVRLISAVREITWEALETEEQALLRENALLRELRPRFNRVNTYPQRHRFISIERNGEAMRMCVLTEARENCFGAFKGQTRAAFRALARMIWTEMHQLGYAALPRALVCEEGPLEVSLPVHERLHARVKAFLTGEEKVVFSEEATEEPEPFFRAFRAADVDLLETFFVAGPLRNRVLRTRFALRAATIPPAELDDLVVRFASLGKRERCAPETDRAISLNSPQHS